MSSSSIWQRFPLLELVWPVFITIPVLVYYIYKKIKKQSQVVLNPATWLKFPLIEKLYISPNTSLYRFALPSPNSTLGLPIGQHISVKFDIDGKSVMRSYTPTTLDNEKGRFDLVVKTYPTGNVSRMFALLQIGDFIDVRGPKGTFKYVPNMVKHLTMVCGGTGITPMYQVAKAILQNPKDQTAISLIFANVNEEDILLQKELDAFSQNHSKQFTVYYVLNNPPNGWKGGVGFVTKEMIADRTPKSMDSKDFKVLLCGPPPMIKAMTTHLEDLKIGSESIFKF